MGSVGRQRNLAKQISKGELHLSAKFNGAIRWANEWVCEVRLPEIKAGWSTTRPSTTGTVSLPGQAREATGLPADVTGHVTAAQYLEHARSLKNRALDLAAADGCRQLETQRRGRRRLPEIRD